MNLPYNRGLARLVTYNWTSQSLPVGVMLVKNTYVFSRQHNIISDIIPNEAAGAGYVRQGAIIGTRLVSEDDITNAAVLSITSGTFSWSILNVGNDIRVVLFITGGGGLFDNNNDLLCYIDTGVGIPISTTGGRVTLNFSANGAIRLEG